MHVSLGHQLEKLKPHTPKTTCLVVMWQASLPTAVNKLSV